MIRKNQTFISNLRLVSNDAIISIIRKMLTKTQEDILDFLLRHPDEQVTIRGLAKRLGKSYTLVYNNLTVLEKKKIIKKISVPPARVISLHESTPTQILTNTELKIKGEFLKKFPWAELMLNDVLSSVKSPFFIFIVFGSYAKGTQTGKSDLDILIITQTKEQAQEIETSLKRVYTKTRKSIIILQTDEFKEMTSRPQEFNAGNEAKKHHVILHGVEQYYQMLKT